MRQARILAFAALSASASALFIACVGDDPVSSSPPIPDAGGGSDAPNGGDTGTTPKEDGAAPGDAAQPSDAGVDSACANKFPAADFCDDFDNGGYQPTWTKLDSTPGVTISIASAPNFSTPHALAASTSNTTPEGGTANTFLRITKPTATATQFTLEARVRQLAPVDVFDPFASPIALQLAVGPTAALSFYIRPNTGKAICTAPSKFIGGNSAQAEMPFTYNEWHHVTMKAVLAGSGTVINLSCDVDGSTRSDTAATAQVDANATGAIGLAAFNGLGPTTYFFDDVVLDFK